jgi:nitroreductase
MDFKMSRINKLNPTLKLINERRTIRAYDPKPLTQEEINTIIHGAMRAPTAGNMMFYSIIQITDQNKKDKLAITCDNQPHIGKAPLVLIFVADMQRWWDYFKICKTKELCNKLQEEFETPKESDLLLACSDALIAAQNAVITAEAMGIGSCYIGDVVENIEIHRKMLNLPRWVFPIIMVCFGYPKGKKENLPLTPRFPQKFIHFKNEYKRLNEKEFSEMFQDVERNYDVNFAENLGQKFYFAKLAADYSKEMRRSVKVAIKDWIKKNDDY